MNDEEIMISQDLNTSMILMRYFEEHPLLIVGLGFSIAVFGMFAYADKNNIK